MIDVENVVTAALRAALPDVTVTNVVDLSKAPLPFVLVDVNPGLSVEGKHRVAWTSPVGVTAFASTRVAAKALALACYDAVVSAPFRPGLPQGCIADVPQAQSPDEVRAPDAPDNVFQFSAIYSVTVRSL